MRRLDQLVQGNFESTSALLRSLPDALGVSPEVVATAVEASKRHLRETEEAAWRAAFRPHAIIITERARPEPLFVACIIGFERLLRIDFDPSSDPLSFAKQAIDGVRAKLAKWQSSELPAFGRPVAVIVNYSPDRAIEFDLNGNPVKAFDRARRIADVSFSIGGRELSTGKAAMLFER